MIETTYPSDSPYCLTCGRYAGNRRYRCVQHTKDYQRSYARWYGRFQRKHGRNPNGDERAILRDLVATEVDIEYHEGVQQRKRELGMLDD